MRGTDAGGRSSDARNKTVPLGRAASADECAGAIWFLLSDEVGLHDRPGDEFHRRPGDVVRRRIGRMR